MTPYEWTVSALDELAVVYVSLPPEARERLAADVDAANHRLGDDPAGAGESRGKKDRVTFAGRLAIWFRVEPGPRAVVYRVNWSGPRPNSPEEPAG